MASVRHALEADVPAMVELGRRMHAESPTYRELSYSPEKAAALGLRVVGTLLNPGGALVAEVNGRIVGMLAGYVVEHWFSHDKVASDYVLYIDPEHRGGMTAVRLIRAFERWAIAQGATVLLPGVSTGVKTEQTRDLYRALGYEPYGVAMMKRCGDGL